MPLDLLEVRPGDRIGIVEAQSRQVVVGHIFGSATGSHGAGVFEHGFVGGGVSGGEDLIDLFFGEGVGIGGVWVVGVAA